LSEQIYLDLLKELVDESETGVLNNDPSGICR
jgi:hypothetical protein